MTRDPRIPGSRYEKGSAKLHVGLWFIPYVLFCKAREAFQSAHHLVNDRGGPLSINKLVRTTKKRRLLEVPYLFIHSFIKSFIEVA